MWDQIHSYETCIETGNEAVNIILSEKLSDCQEKGITFTPYLDGHLLDFIEPLDICTILGNALDNAIEASEGIPDPAKRIITLNVLSKNNFLSVSVCNFFQTIPSQINGKLQTTKKDSFSHGYGMQNMQHTAEKYGGHLSYRIKEDLFTLDFLFPFH